MAKKYLNVRYEDRTLAKRLGARWDPDLRRWYCPKGSQLDIIFRWRAEAKTVESQSNVEVKTMPTRNDNNRNFELPLAM